MKPRISGDLSEYISRLPEEKRREIISLSEQEKNCLPTQKILGALGFDYFDSQKGLVSVSKRVYNRFKPGIWQELHNRLIHGETVAEYACSHGVNGDIPELFEEGLLCLYAIVIAKETLDGVECRVLN